jgi:hypothetical protein
MAPGSTICATDGCYGGYFLQGWNLVRKAEAKTHLGGLRDNKMLMLSMRIDGKASLYTNSIDGCTKHKATKEALVAISLPEPSFAAACY